MQMSLGIVNLTAEKSALIGRKIAEMCQPTLTQAV
jgi:hypothetical protein